jgi:exopolysaccharide production protein ExoQ
VTYFVAAISFLVPLLGVWAPLGLAPLMAFAAIVSVPVFRWQTGAWPKISVAGIAFLAAFGVWAAISLGWAPDFAVAGRKLASLVLLILMGLAFLTCAQREAGARDVAVALVAGLLLAIGSMLIERYAGAPVYRLINGEFPPHEWPHVVNRFNRGMTVIAILAWPVAHAAGRWHPLARIAVFGAVAGAALSMNSDAALLSLLPGAACYAIIWLLPKYRVVAWLGGVAAVSVLLMPAAMDRVPVDREKTSIKASLSESGYHRLLIWKFSNDRIADHPILGWGFNASRSITDGATAIDTNLPSLPLHPHSAALQWRLELGLPGAVLGSVLVFLMFARTRRYRDRNDRASAAAAIGAGLTIACLSYGAWQSWWVAALIFGAGSVLLVSPVNREHGHNKPGEILGVEPPGETYQPEIEHRDLTDQGGNGQHMRGRNSSVSPA